MRFCRVFSAVTLAGAFAVMQVAGAPAWAAKKPQTPPAAQTQQAQAPQAPSDKCPGGVSKGCGPGSCRCP
jgi:hypothetical protein